MHFDHMAHTDALREIGGGLHNQYDRPPAIPLVQLRLPGSGQQRKHMFRFVKWLPTMGS